MGARALRAAIFAAPITAAILFAFGTPAFADTATINAGAMGNDGPMISMREFWFSPELGFNLVSIVDDVQSGKQVFTVKEISTGEPNQSYFEIPSDYKVVDHRYEKTTDQDPAPTAR